MIATRADALRIIASHYGPAFEFIIPAAPEYGIGLRPGFDVRPILAYQALGNATDSPVRIGRILRPSDTGSVDWTWQDTEHDDYAARQVACDRVGCNFYGRLDVVRDAIESGRDADARRELLALLRFFPAAPRKVQS